MFLSIPVLLILAFTGGYAAKGNIAPLAQSISGIVSTATPAATPAAK